MFSQAKPGSRWPSPALAGSTGKTTHLDPVTGQQVSDGGTGGGTAVGAAAAVPTVLADSQSKSTSVTLSVLAGFILLMLLIVPPLVAQRLKRRTGGP